MTLVTEPSNAEGLRHAVADIDLAALRQQHLVHRPKPGQAWAKWVLGLMGWKLNFAGLPAQAVVGSNGEKRQVSRGVIIAYPHTSNWDGVVGVLAIWALGIELTLWGKASLFKVPVLSSLLRSVGAIPVKRTEPEGAVAKAVADMQAADVYWLGLAPEGTRKLSAGWRTGFYQVACQANVPVGLAHLDWGKKEIGVTRFLSMTGNETVDLARIRAGFGGVVGCVPSNASPIQWMAKSGAAEPASPGCI